MPGLKTERVPAGLRAAALDFQARQITDPVERLRYLRKAAGRQWAIPAVPRGSVRLACLVSVVGVALIASSPLRHASSSDGAPVHSGAMPAAATLPPTDVWMVEEHGQFSLYSNGLRIENEFTVPGEPRSGFPIYDHRVGEAPVAQGTEPAGVVFHSTESDQVPFAPSHARALTRLGRNLLEYVRLHRSYHFVIDRFGRVYRIVHESDKANHAGHSVWAGTQGILVNLNASFLAVAFEARTGGEQPLNRPQIHSARLLTEMLRSMYRLDPSSFLTHAQVSVNPSNMRIGYHTDWATGLPFAALGLPDNYSEVVGSVALFGFDYDTTFLKAMGGVPWSGLLAASENAAQAAVGAGFSPFHYRREMQKRFKRILQAQTRLHDGMNDENQPKR